MDVRDVNERTEENLAHRFAASFLVTATTARRELGVKRRHLDFRELAMLKQKHGLSMQAWILRAADLAIIERSHARVLLAEMKRKCSGRRRKFRRFRRPTKIQLMRPEVDLPVSPRRPNACPLRHRCWLSAAGGFLTTLVGACVAVALVLPL